MKTEQVKKRMKDMNILAHTMAEELGMNDSTYYRKMKNNGDGFSATDLIVFKRKLELDEAEALDFLLS